MRVARAMVTATKRTMWWATKRALATEIAIATATGVVGNKESDGKGS